MIEGLYGIKKKMVRLFDETGKSIPVTLIACGPCYVVNREEERVQIGYMEIKEKRATKARVGYLKKRQLPPLKHLKYVKWSGKDAIPDIGQKINCDTFSIGEIINVQGLSKGKGTAGTMKRWNFNGGPAAHGSKFHRLPGSIGNHSYPARVWPGKKMAGHLGSEKVTVKNLKIIDIDVSENIIAVKGAVPGPAKSLLYLKRSGKGKSGK